MWFVNLFSFPTLISDIILTYQRLRNDCFCQGDIANHSSDTSILIIPAWLKKNIIIAFLWCSLNLSFKLNKISHVKHCACVIHSFLVFWTISSTICYHKYLNISWGMACCHSTLLYTACHPAAAAATLEWLLIWCCPTIGKMQF